MINRTRTLASFSISNLLLAMFCIRGQLWLVTETLEFRDKCGDTRVVCEETLGGTIHAEEILEDSSISRVSVDLGEKSIQLNELFDKCGKVTTTESLARCRLYGEILSSLP